MRSSTEVTVVTFIASLLSMFVRSAALSLPVGMLSPRIPRRYVSQAIAGTPGTIRYTRRTSRGPALYETVARNCSGVTPSGATVMVSSLASAGTDRLTMKSGADASATSGAAPLTAIRAVASAPSFHTSTRSTTELPIRKVSPSSVA